MQDCDFTVRHAPVINNLGHMELVRIVLTLTTRLLSPVEMAELPSLQKVGVMSAKAAVGLLTIYANAATIRCLSGATITMQSSSIKDEFNWRAYDCAELLRHHVKILTATVSEKKYLDIDSETFTYPVHFIRSWLSSMKIFSAAAAHAFFANVFEDTIREQCLHSYISVIYIIYSIYYIYYVCYVYMNVDS